MKSRWYAKVPKDPIANRRFRLDLIRESAGSVDARDWLRAACKDDPIFYFNAFVWTYDPRLPENEKILPFITFSIQDDAIRRLNDAIEYGRDVVIEKSRDMGVSWICCGLFEKRWHFNRDQTFMMISRDADEVDKPGYPDCLFWKIDAIHRHLPSWLMPRGWDARRNRKKMVFDNPENGSTINGEATVAGAAVGGRKTAMLMDEFSRIPFAYELLLGTADSSRCRIFNFTPYGTSNSAYDLATRTNITKLRLHWSADPRKNQKMYKWDGEHQKLRYYRWNDEKLEIEECGPHLYTTEDDDLQVPEHPRKFEPVRDGVLRSPVYDREDTRRANRQAMAMMWDIDYIGSEWNFFDKTLLTQLCRETAIAPLWEGDIQFDEATGDLECFEEKRGGPLKLWVSLTRDLGVPRGARGYAAGCDIALGVGATPSCISIGDVATGVKVASYVNAYDKPERLAAKAVALGNAFRSKDDAPMFLAWERNGPGNTFGDRVMELGYTDVYIEGENQRANTRTQRKPGWGNDNRQKLQDLLGQYSAALSQRRFVNRDEDAIRECERFKVTDKGIEYVASGKRARVSVNADSSREQHGDRVIADAIMWLASRYMGGPDGLPEERAEEPERMPNTLAFRRAEFVRRQMERC